jgi:hypothetical protein
MGHTECRMVQELDNVVGKYVYSLPSVKLVILVSIKILTEPRAL